LREILRQLPGTDEKQAPVRSMQRNQRMTVEFELIAAFSRRDVDGTGLHVEPALNELVLLDALEQLVETAFRTERLEHELDRTAARQAEALRLLRGDTIARAGGCILNEIATAHARDHVVFDTASGHRTFHDAVVPYRSDCADRSRRRAPRVHDGGEHHAMARLEPISCALEYLQIDAVHDGLQIG
jgi:hypothetical protein